MTKIIKSLEILPKPLSRSKKSCKTRFNYPVIYNIIIVYEHFNRYF